LLEIKFPDISLILAKFHLSSVFDKIPGYFPDFSSYPKFPDFSSAVGTLPV